jgi:hypothetical protein
LVVSQRLGHDSPVATTTIYAPDCRDLVRLAAPSAVADEHTVDVVFVLSGPGVYADLTGDRGWPAAAYEQWLTTALESLLCR